MNYWITTDTHFNHLQMIEYCGRPINFGILIRKHLKSMVKKGDVLIHLGDICIGNDTKCNNWFKELPSRNILVKGNHDNKSHKWYMENGWDLACDRLDLNIFGKKIAFTHIPVGWDGYFDVNIHGHFHNANYRRYEEDLKKIINSYHKLLAIEYTDYKPVNLDKFINK